MDTAQLISKAKAVVALIDRGIGSISSSFMYTLDDKLPAVMATDGTTVYYNSHLINNNRFLLGDLAFIVAHEAAHVMLGHHFRILLLLKGIDIDSDEYARLHYIANKAADYVINPLLIRKFKVSKQFQENILLDDRFDGKNMETIFNILLAEQIAANNPDKNEQKSQQQPDHQDNQQESSNKQEQNSQSQSEDHDSQKQSNDQQQSDSQSDTDNQAGQLESDSHSELDIKVEPWQIGVINPPPISTKGIDGDKLNRKLQQELFHKLSQTTKLFGKGMISGLRDEIDQLLTPKKDPWQILSNFLDTVVREQYNYMRPNRRYIQDNIYLPTLHNKVVGKAIVGVDTSASINEEQMQTYASHVSDLLEKFPDLEVEVIYWDDSVYADKIAIYSNSDLPLQFEIPGYGGTAPEEFLRFLVENDYEDIRFCLVFTDLEFWTWDEMIQPEFPVFWLDTSHCKYNQAEVRFGEIIEI